MKRYEVNAVLFVKLDHIGDMILATPVFRAVKERYPECRLGVLCSSKGKAVLLNNPYVDEIHVYNPDMFDRDHDNNLSTKFNNFLTILEVRDRHYDVCISLREDHENAIIQKMTGAAFHIAFSSNCPYPWLLDYSIPKEGATHEAEKNFMLLELLDIVRPPELETELFPGKEDFRWADRFLQAHGVGCSDKVIAVCPGGGWFLNWWPWESYAELCDDLWEYDPHYRILIVGGKAELDVVEKIKGKCRCEIINACGMTTLQQLSALYSRVNLVVCNDGGPMHVASTVGVPMIALFGPSPKWFYPVGENITVIHKKFACSPCPQFQPGEKPKCLDNKCMRTISEKEVFRKAVEILEFMWFHSG